MIFIRPFYHIRCFQFRWIKEIGFKRLNTFDLTPDEFQKCNKDTVIFCKNNKIEKYYRSGIKIDDSEIDLTPHYAKEAAKEITDLFISDAILSKTIQKGIFILPDVIINKPFSEFIIKRFQEKTGLAYKKYVVLTSIHKNIFFIFSYLIQMGYIIKYFLQSFNKKNIDCTDKIIYDDLAPSHMNLDPNKKLSATFIIDDQKIKKENIIYFSNDKKKSDLWRNENFNIYKEFSELCSTKDLLLGWFTFIKKTPFLYKNIFSSKNIFMLSRLVISYELSKRKKIRGYIYTNTSIIKEPIEALVFFSQKIPVIIISYSASSFYGPHWSYLSCTRLFVWHKIMKDFVQDHPQVRELDIKISGPLMMGEDLLSKEIINNSKKEIHSKLKNMNSLLIGIFDVAPHKLRLLENARLSVRYTSGYHKKFMFDIFYLLSEIENVSLVIKPKRWTKHSPDYNIEDSVMEYIQNNEKIVTLDSGINPYLSVQSCDIIICMAYTSIYYAAQQKGIPAIFYSPIKDEALENEKGLDSLLSIGKKDLLNRIKGIVNNKNEGLISGNYYEDLVGINKHDSIRHNFINQLNQTFEA